MESCRVPIELCEAIIDTLPIRTIASTRGDYYVGLQAQRTLRACALTCRAWRVRAQLNLWVSPHLESEHYLALFAATLRTGPKPLITNLWLHQSTFVRSTELFMHIFPNLRNVTCSKVDFNHGPPLSILRMRLPFFAGVTVLRIVHCRFHSLRAMMDMVWAFPNLSELELSFFTFKFAPLPAAGGRVDLSAICGHLRSCQKLARLKLIIPATPAAEDVPPPFTAAAFGHAAIELVVGPYYTSNHLGRFLRPDSFPSLRLISILARPSSYDRGVPWLHAIVACRAVPWMLERIVIEYGHDWRREEHACCQEVVGASEEVAGSPQRLPELVSGLKELTIRFDQREAPRRCGAYILSVLPNMRKVLRFEYSPLETDCWEEYTLPVAR